MGGNGENDYITVTEAFTPSASIPFSDEASTGTERVAQTPSSPLLQTTLVSPSDEAYTGTENAAQTSSSPFPQITLISPSDEVYTGMENAAQKSPSLFLPAAAVANEVINAKEDFGVPKENLVRNEDLSGNIACKGSGDFVACDGGFEGQVGAPEDRPYEVFLGEGAATAGFGVVEQTLTQDFQRISCHKAKNCRTAHGRPVRMSRERAEFGHHDRRANRVLRKALRLEGSTRCDRSVTRVELRPEGEQEGMEIEVGDTLGGVPEDIPSMDWHSPAMQVITMPHQPTRDTTPPQTHNSQPAVSREEEMGDAGDLMNAVLDTVASQVKRRIMADGKLKIL